MNINTSLMSSIEGILQSQPEDTEFAQLINEALQFISSHKWCKSVEKQWFTVGWENILAIFLFKIVPNPPNVDDYVWVLVGDLPPAYIDIESATNEREVIEVYTEIMEDWVNCVKSNQPLDHCYPVNVPPTKDYAEMLLVRIKFIKEHILSRLPPPTN